MNIRHSNSNFITTSRRLTTSRQDMPSGFTLLELMVALAVGAIAITSVYAVGAASTQQFREQQRVSNLQTSLRLAINQIKRDVARIAYQASPDLNQMGETCMTTKTFSPITLNENADIGLVDTSDFADGVLHADRFTMVGNYVTRSEYLIRGLAPNDATSQAAFLQTNWQAFRRDFVTKNSWADEDPLTDAFNPQAFANVFQPHRWLRLRNQDGHKFFVSIVSTLPLPTDSPPLVMATIPQINFNTPTLPLGTECVGGLMSSAKAAPLSMIRYRLFDGTGQGTSDDDTNIYGKNVQLVREELDPDNPTASDPLLSATTTVLSDNSRRILLDYVVSFNVSAIMDANEGVQGDSPCLWLFEGGANTNPQGRACEPTNPATFIANQLRTIIVELSVRTPEHDPNFLWPGTQITGPPIGRYRALIDDDSTEGSTKVIQRVGASRVRTLRAEILVPNIAYD